MSAVTVIPSLLPLFVVIAMRRAEARIHRQFVDAGAFTAESAIELSFARSMDRRRLRGLVDGGAVRATAANRHFLDRDGWDRYQRGKRRRALLAVCIVIALLGAVLAVVWALR